MFWTFFLQIIGICAMMPSRNDNTAERAKLNEEDMESSKAPGRSSGPTRREAMRANRAGKRKNTVGGPRKSLIRLDSDKENPSSSLGWAWLDLAQFGSVWPNLDSAWIFLGFLALHIDATELIQCAVANAPAMAHLVAHPAFAAST
jgi:hypothetical protein